MVCSQGRKPLDNDRAEFAEPQRGGRSLMRRAAPPPPSGAGVTGGSVTRGSRPWLQTSAPSGLGDRLLDFLIAPCSWFWSGKRLLHAIRDREDFIKKHAPSISGRPVYLNPPVA